MIECKKMIEGNFGTVLSCAEITDESEEFVIEEIYDVVEGGPEIKVRGKENFEIDKKGYEVDYENQQELATFMAIHKIDPNEVYYLLSNWEGRACWQGLVKKNGKWLYLLLDDNYGCTGHELVRTNLED